MDKFCQDSFWDYNITWNTEIPDFTTCFQDIILVSTPYFAFLITTSVCLCLLLRNSSHNPLPWTWLNITKLVLALSLLTISVIWCGILFRDKYADEDVANSTIMSSCTRVVTFVLVTITMLLHRSRGVTTSYHMSIFWIIFTICGVFLHRSSILKYFTLETETRDVICILNMLFYPMIYVQFFLSALADTKAFDFLNEENVMAEVTFLSFLLFTWFNKVIAKSRKRILTVSDLAFLNVRLTTGHIYRSFSKHWKLIVSTENQKSKSLAWALVKSFWHWIVLGIILDIVFVFVMVMPPLILDRIINFVHHDEFTWRGYLFGFLIYLTTFAGKTLEVHSLYLLTVAGGQLKAALMGAVYRKNLLISISTRKTYFSGTLVNLMSVDVERIREGFFYCPSLISSPINMVVIIYIMWQYIGPSCFAGVGVMLVLVPITMYATRYNERYMEKQMEKKDLRLKYMNEILSGIKILKLYAWEIPFSGKVSETRKAELMLIRNTQLCRVVLRFAVLCAPFMVSIASFGTFLFVNRNNVLDPTKAFVSLTLMDQLRFALFNIPDALVLLVECNVAMERLRKFFFAENTDMNIIGNQPEKGEALSIKDATFSWDTGSEPTLMDLDLHVSRGKLIAVIGPVGSGKSSMLSAILGEMHKINGSVDVKGSIAYVPQQAWILNRTLKENVILVKTMKEDIYNKILDYCCLRPDLEILPHGDETEIGEKGVNLSGGQKQRISVARAVFQDKDIYLLDDPLSAVDVHVRKSLFDDVISNEGFLKKKTRILVTHDVSFLHRVDMVVSMKEGRIDEIGSYHDLLKRDGSFTKFVQEHTNAKTLEENMKQAPRPIRRFISADSTTSNEISFQNELQERRGSAASVFRERGCKSTGSESVRAINRSLSRRISTDSLTRKTSFEESLTEDIQSSASSEEFHKETAYRLMEDEKMEIGKVNLRIYWEYVKHVGILVFLIELLGSSAIVGFETGANVWLSKWSSEGLQNGTISSDSTTWRLSIYASLGLAQATCVFVSGTLLVLGSKRASEKYHKEMLESVIKSPMSFFDSTPMGRIVNRFSADMDVMDMEIFPLMDDWLNCMISCIASFVIIGMNTPIFLIIILPVGISYFFIQKMHLNTFRQIMRLESTTRSPIYSHFLESIQGVSSICAYNIQEDFTKEFEEKLNKHMLCSFNSASCTRWLNFWLNVLGCSIVLITATLAIHQRSTLNPAVIGLMITYSLLVTDSLMWFIRIGSDLETKSISIERLDEYCKLKSEAPWNLSLDSFQNDWPQNGSIAFDRYSTRYAEGLDLVLNNINLQIESNEKVGIVGRTGAGKSSITMALFRIIEPETGTILIDDIDITKLGLQCLRSKLTIIPQDPVLFTGTLRMNLDPNNDYNDDEIWESLEKAHLKSFVANLTEALEYNLEEGGSNFSAGQRQLLCLSRALLKRSKILVLDEATASVDMDTDCLIQNTIRTVFANHTVITVAHRLNTIIDYDKIVVMENGKVIEVGNPANLLKDNESKFHHMCKDAGLCTF